MADLNRTIADARRLLDDQAIRQQLEEGQTIMVAEASAYDVNRSLIHHRRLMEASYRTLAIRADLHLDLGGREFWVANLEGYGEIGRWP